MKINIIFFFMVLICGCAAQKKTTILNEYNHSKSISLKSCLENYSCSLKIIPNKSITLEKDEFAIFYGQIVKSDSILVKYELKRKTPKNIADGEFIETIYFNISKFDTEIHLKDEELNKINLVLQRQCYCKGSVGFFKINKGSFKFNIEKNELTLIADFNVENIPHVLQKINEKVMLAP